MWPTPEPVSMPARLDIFGGKSVKFGPVSTFPSELRIVKPSQNQSSNLTVYKVPNKQDSSVSMAFCFELKQEKYVLGVEAKKICFEIQEQSKPTDFSNKFLFRWANNKGQFGSLCSVAEPNKYLRAHGKKVTLSDEPDHDFKINFL